MLAASFIYKVERRTFIVRRCYLIVADLVLPGFSRSRGGLGGLFGDLCRKTRPLAHSSDSLAEALVKLLELVVWRPIGTHIVTLAGFAIPGLKTVFGLVGVAGCRVLDACRMSP